MRAGCLLLGVALQSSLAVAQTITLSSPSGAVEARITADQREGLSYRVFWQHRPLAPSAHIGLRTDQHELGVHTVAAGPPFGELNEHYPFLGAKAIATNHARTVSIPMQDSDGSSFIP